MITRLKNSFPTHNIILEDSIQLFVIDYKPINRGVITLTNVNPNVPHVLLNNENRVPIYFDGFPDNAFVLSPGEHCKQCECIIFPQSCTPDDWILVIETKYTFDIVSAFDRNYNYPICMIDQIIDAVDFLRSKGIILGNKTVNAIVSFPRLIEDFSSFFFTGGRSIEDILLNHRIKMRATNSAIIKNNRKIRI